MENSPEGKGNCIYRIKPNGKLLLSIGTRVRFRHSKDTGVVTALLDDGMVEVLLDDAGMEIPVFADDLIRLEETPHRLSSIRAKIVPGKQRKKTPPPHRPEIETQYTILKSRGIQLAFDPVVKAEDLPAERYNVFLINDTPYDVLYAYQMNFRNATHGRQTGKLPSLGFVKMGELLFDQLNDAPQAHIECWRITTEGTGRRLERKLRIRPKQFFNRVSTAPLLNRRVHLYRLFEKLHVPAAQKKEEDLRSYTRRKAQTLDAWESIRQRISHDVLELAEFIPEIDLHAEKLTDYHPKMSNAEILRLQLRHFERYIDQALRVGAERVFIIHGVGKGRLRDAIANRLGQMPEVDTFKNEYHPRYGWGATEVLFA